MADFGLGSLVVDPPAGPTFATAPPAAPTVVVAPVAGPPGPGGTGSRLLHTQATPAATWTITHTFGRYPLVQLLDAAGVAMDADIDYPDDATVVVTFATPTAGYAALN